MPRQRVQLVHERRHAAEIPIDLIEDGTGLAPCISYEDAMKLDLVRSALEQGDVRAAARYGRIFKLVPVAV